MREATKITVRYQFFRIILMQAAASGVAFVFGAVAFWYFTNINIAKQILSAVFIIVNFAFLYTASRKFATLDGKPYTPLSPSPAKGVLLGAAVALLNLIFMLVFRLLWVKFGTDVGISGVIPTIFNAFFYLWSFPYNGLMNLENGVFTVYSGVLMLVVPIAATTAGYIAGMKKFELTEKLDEFIYEKED